MAYADFYNDGYNYITEGNYILFSADKSHDDLFNYAATDISSLTYLFDQYITSKMDTTTFELRHSSKSNDDIGKITELLKSAHPYYKHEYKAVIIKAIGEYFNELLIYSVYKQGTLSPDLPLHPKWYHDKFTNLMPLFVQEQKGYYPDGLYPDDFYTKYRTLVDDKNFDMREIEETFLPVPQIMPSGFSGEIITHKIVRSMLYFILDTTANGLKDLSISQRIWFYGNIFYTRDYWTRTHITKYLSYLPPIIYKGNNDYSSDVEHKWEIYEMFRPIYMLDNLDIEYENISALVPESFNSAIECAKKIETSKFYEKYEINCLRELLLQEIILMVQSGIKIRKCKNCGRYFIVSKSNQKYCNRLFEKTKKRCSQIGRSRSYQKETENDPIRKLYKAAYNKHHSHIRNDIPETKSAFNQWSEEASTKWQTMRNGELSTEKFIEWLIETSK